MTATLTGTTAIVGIGQTEFSKESGRTELQLAAEASLAAITDAGLTPSDIDGAVTFVADQNDELALIRNLGVPELKWMSRTPNGDAPAGSEPAGAEPSPHPANRASRQSGARRPHGYARRSYPRAASSHSASVGRRPPTKPQYCRAMAKVTVARGKAAAASGANASGATARANSAGAARLPRMRP